MPVDSLRVKPLNFLKTQANLSLEFSISSRFDVKNENSDFVNKQNVTRDVNACACVKLAK